MSDNITVIVEPQQTEVAVELSPMGAPGEQGPIGPQGPIGVTGPSGADGARGIQGEPGPPGADGAPGIQGEVGPPGAPGPAGADGAPGPAGADGPEGPAGADGAPGPAGADGPEGPQGPIGLTGPQGAVGPQGIQGFTGAQGDVGPQGPIGLTGPEGPQGETGAAGANAVIVPAWTAVNFLVQGAIDTGIAVPPAPIPVRVATQTVKIIGLRASILGTVGSTATISFRRNSVALAEQLPSPANEAGVLLTLVAPITLAHLDKLDFICTAATGDPNDASVTFILEHAAV